MTVNEYALDVDKSVSEILSLCKKLDIKATNKDYLLSQDDITNLDNSIMEDSQTEEDEIDRLEDIVEDIVSTTKIPFNDMIKNQKLKKKDSTSNKDYINQKKMMYKSKEKLKNNHLEEDVILYEEGMTVGALATKLNVPAKEIIQKLITLGIMIGMNATIDFDYAQLICQEYKKQLKNVGSVDQSNFEEYEIVDEEKDLVERPAVVTIMGHVDHGKTTLLDTIRDSNIIEGEHGGITQHIGAYKIKHKDKEITFIDTPGHEAFTEMRARGASITDIVIIIVAADDGVMPQTKEAIEHAKASSVPIIVAVNKIDKTDGNIDRIMTELSNYGLTPEEWGGDTLYVKISALKRIGIEDLLENILLIGELNGYKANPNRYATGTVIEAKQDKNLGSVTTLLVQSGTLRIGDPIVVGTCYGKIRNMKNDLNQNVVEATPSVPITITGLDGIPSAGDRFMAFETEKQAKSILNQRKTAINQVFEKRVSLEDLFNKIKEGIKEVKVIIKADTKGSEEVLKNTLGKINVDGVRINFIRSGVGTVTETDISLAKASDAVIIGFNIRPNQNTMDIAKQEGIEIRLYNVIYKALEDMENAMKGMLDPVYEEVITGNATVRKIFKFSKIGIIAGSYINSGIIKRNSKARVIRDNVVIYDGNIKSIQREKDTVNEVKNGLECGITLDSYNDIKENDIVETYELKEVIRK